MKIHHSITLEEVMQLVEADEGYAICIHCGSHYDGHLEPDAHDVLCDSCETHNVCGVEEILLMLPFPSPFERL
jgi:Zn finger protein HypA/HybF involved in hydrogenase expression